MYLSEAKWQIKEIADHVAYAQRSAANGEYEQVGLFFLFKFKLSE